MRNVLAAVLCTAINPRNTPIVILRQRSRTRKRATPNEARTTTAASSAGFEGVSGKKAVDSEAVTGKNGPR
jgi:hypothetical protein